MPQNLIVSFKNDKILFEMIGFGKSGILNLVKSGRREFLIHTSVFLQKNIIMQQNQVKYFPGFEAMNDMDLKKDFQDKSNMWIQL